MKIIKPDFYDNFKCVADKCTDSCCSAGWQIDIDSKSLEKYSLSNDEYLLNLIKNTQKINKCYYIKLNSNKKCPYFVNGLCDIVLKKGDGYLNNTCRMFPRYQNTSKDICETGLSIACEEVCKILLLRRDKINLLCNNKEYKYNNQYVNKQKLIDIIQDRNLSIQERITNLLLAVNVENNYDFNKVLYVLNNLEYLSIQNSKIIKELKDIKLDNFKDYEIENLLFYFIYKYYNFNNLHFGLQSIVKFAILSVYCIDKMVGFYKAKSVLENKVLALKNYGREIECSPENKKIILETLKK